MREAEKSKKFDFKQVRYGLHKAKNEPITLIVFLILLLSSLFFAISLPMSRRQQKNKEAVGCVRHPRFYVNALHLTIEPVTSVE